MILPPPPRRPDPVERLLRGLGTAPVNMAVAPTAVNACLLQLKRLVAEVSRQELGPKRRRSSPRVKKVTRSKWRGKKAGDKGRVHARPFAVVCRVLVPEASAAGPTDEPAPDGPGTG